MSADIEFVAVESAATVAGISPRTLRYWIASGKLPARGGKRGRLVKLADVQELARLTGRANGNGSLPADSTVNVAGNVAEPSGFAAIERQLAEYRAMVERLHQENLALAGQLGFCQARLQAAEAETARLAGLLAAPAASPVETPESAETAPEGMGNRSGGGENGPRIDVQRAPKAARRHWWRLWAH